MLFPQTVPRIGDRLRVFLSRLAAGQSHADETQANPAEGHQVDQSSLCHE